MLFAPINVDGLVEQILDLTKGIPAEALAVGVGAVVGVTLFLVMMIAFRRNRQSARDRVSMPSANDVVFIPPYAARLPAAQKAGVQQWRGARGQRPTDQATFHPSSALSARVFAKMGLAYDEEEAIASSEVCVVGGTAPMPALDANGQAIARVLEVGMLEVEVEVPMPLQSVECLFDVEEPAVSSSALETQPASIVRISAEQPDQPRNGSVMLAAAPIHELDLDDAPTHLREPAFEEPPQAPRRTTPPKIRKIDPQSARQHGGPLGPLPRVTPPPFAALQITQTPQTEPISRPF